MKSPRISIIVPTFQEERYIEQTLRQFCPELRERCGAELIVSDGGSTDATAALARPLADLVIVSDKEQTIAAGRNAGAMAARGEIVMFLNADVRLVEPARFIAVMAESVADPAVAAATCPVLVNPEEETLPDRLFHRSFNWYCHVLNMIGMGMGRGECHVLRKSVFERSGGYNDAVVAGEDYEFFLRLRRMGNIAFVKTLLLYESPRRYRAYGYLRVSALWFANAICVLFLKRSLSRRWMPIR
ncbi:MAG TPA: glycosyltransferase [Bacteroidota bacterium]|jgi:glycosyltransferase involved in cell wall biosynthesis|nr:glycosyltransferase [Bacteroidota bacterium]